MPLPINAHLENVHISKIKVGDIILHHEELRTVCANHIKWSAFMGRSIFGDNYHSGYKSVIKVHFLCK